MEVDAALFDRVRTCDNHCEFCFIHQLPKGMRKSLYVRDDDYRLSFLYGNFTTLTRFTESDLERVLTEGLSPLFVSIHATDPEVRARMLRNRRGATSLRWLRALLDGGRRGARPGRRLPRRQRRRDPGGHPGRRPRRVPRAGQRGLRAARGEPLQPGGGDAARTRRPRRPRAVDLVEEWQAIFLACLGRRLVYAADEYYLVAGRPFPALETYGAVAQHDNGIGMARAFEAAFDGRTGRGPWEKRAERFLPLARGGSGPRLPAPRAPGARDAAPPTGRPATTMLTGEYGARVLAPARRLAGATSRWWPCATSSSAGTSPWPAF